MHVPVARGTDTRPPKSAIANSANQFITEVQIYKYLAMHPCHTENPLEADVFIVPAQTVSGIWLSREKGPNGEPPLKDEGATYMKEGEYRGPSRSVYSPAMLSRGYLARLPSGQNCTDPIFCSLRGSDGLAQVNTHRQALRRS